MLDLTDNQLTELPYQLADALTGGLVIRLHGNPLREPLPELVERGGAELIAYLRSLEDAVVQYEAKLLLVGEGNVGKTSLVSALKGEEFIEGRPTTHGIEISAIPFQHPDLDLDMTLRAWDFGGQQVYRVSHQFFFTPRALFLVVWHARQGQERDEVEDWLRRIKLRVGDAAVAMVVATHSGTAGGSRLPAYGETLSRDTCRDLPNRQSHGRGHRRIADGDRRTGVKTAADGPAVEPALDSRPRGGAHPRKDRTTDPVRTVR